MVGHYLARSGGHSYCSSRDIILFVCHLIKEIRVIKVSVTITYEHLRVSHHPPCQVWCSETM